MLLSSAALADSTRCQLEGSSVGATSIAWDSLTGEAKVTNRFNFIQHGKITNSRMIGSELSKLNIFVKYKKPHLGHDADEYLVLVH